MDDQTKVTCWKCGTAGRVLEWEGAVPVNGVWESGTCAPGMGLHDWEKPTPSELIEAGNRSMATIREIATW